MAYDLTAVLTTIAAASASIVAILGGFIASKLITISSETVLSLADKEVLSKVIVAQLMRIPESFNYVTGHIYPRVSKHVKQEVTSLLPPILLEEYGDQLRNIEFPEQYQKEIVLNHAFEPKNFDRYCRILQDHFWVACVNVLRSKIPFITSDNPVLVEGIGRQETGLFSNGLASPTTCIFYPLSPVIAVSIISPKSQSRVSHIRPKIARFTASSRLSFVIVFGAISAAFLKSALLIFLSTSNFHIRL